MHSKRLMDLLLDTKNHLDTAYHLTPLAIPRGENAYSGKISRGENYRGLPYLILDYPAYFSQKDIFAFRTMFWWGHFFQCRTTSTGDIFAATHPGNIQ